MSTRIKAFRYVWNRHEILVGKYLKTKIRRSLTKHFTETFPLIHLYPFRTIIDSNRHKSLLNRWLNSHHPVHCLLLRIKFLCPREMSPRTDTIYFTMCPTTVYAKQGLRIRPVVAPVNTRR